MSMSFNDQPPSKGQLEMMRLLCGEPVVMDDKTALFNAMPQEMDGGKLETIGRIEANVEGEIKTVAGTQYRVTPRGWVKI